MPTSDPSQSLLGQKKWTTGLLLLFYALYCWRVANYVAHNISPMFFNDQWDFYPVFSWADQVSYFNLFFQQFGPHRLGLGHVLSVALGRLTGFDLRYEVWLGLFIFAFNGFLAWKLKVRLTGKKHPVDIFLWVLPLNLAQGEIFVAHINFYMGPVPQLLILLMAHCLVRGLRSVSSLLTFLGLNFLAVFSGYAFFAGLLSPVVLIFKVFAERNSRLRAQYLLGLALSLGTLWLFSISYHFSSAVACYQFPHPRPWEYFGYVAFMFGRFLFENAKGLPFVAGLLCIAGFILAVVYYLREARSALFLPQAKKDHFWETQATPETYLAPLFLLGFGALYCGAAAVGRICLGVSQGSSSRYIPYLVLPVIALFIYFSQRQKKRLLFFMLSLFLVSEFYWRQRDMNKTFAMYSIGKKEWQKCYLELGSTLECSQKVGFKPHPDATSPSFQAKLNFLKDRGWNLFKESNVPTQSPLK